MANFIVRDNTPVARDDDYADLDLDFEANPVTGDVLIRKGANAIVRSVRNLILSNFYERPFRSYLGSGVQQLLFEPLTPLTMTYIKQAIEEVIRNYEPRVRLDNVELDAEFLHRDDEGGYREPMDDQTIKVTLTFTILNSEQPVVTGLFLERIR